MDNATADRLRYRAMLLDEIAYHDSWHSAQARRLGGDAAHARAALLMRRLHAQLQAWPADHPDWESYAQAWITMHELDGLALGESQRALLRSYGYDAPASDAAHAFLQVLLVRLSAARAG